MMWKIFSLALIAADVPAVADASRDWSCWLGDHPDKVTTFPGWNQPLPSAWYSGYLEYELEGRQVHTHYVLVQAEENENGNEELPLIYVRWIWIILCWWAPLQLV
jgi:hypothetical protein